MELLVRIVNRSPEQTASKYGDCIVAMPDGWAWSPEELSNEVWVLISSNITVAESEALQQALIDASTEAVLAYRRYTVDLNALGIQPRPQSSDIVIIPAPALRSVIYEKT